MNKAPPKAQDLLLAAKIADCESVVSIRTALA